MISNISIAQEQLLLLFEQHLFILADPFPENLLPPISGEFVKTEMDFSGDVNGHFVMLFPEDKSKEVICNFLGLKDDDPQINEMTTFDASNEIVNILGAHILSSWLDEAKNFNIGLPKSSNFEVAEHSEFLKGNNITGILIDDEPVFLKIMFK